LETRVKKLIDREYLAEDGLNEFKLIVIEGREGDIVG